jgi:hypothetical protein
MDMWILPLQEMDVFLQSFMMSKIQLHEYIYGCQSKITACNCLSRKKNVSTELFFSLENCQFSTAHDQNR